MAKTIEIAEIKIGNRKRKDMGDIGPLVDSINEIGLLHPIVVTPQKKLIAGLRRIKAFQQMKQTTIPCHVVNLEKVILGERDENLVRKAFTPSEEVAIADAVEPIERAAAKERQKEAGKEHGKGQIGGANLAPAMDTKVRQRVARSLGIGYTTLGRAREVVAAAEKAPKKYGKLVEEMDRTGRVAGVYKKLTVAKQAEAIKREKKPLPKGPFRVIIADPPWTYSNRPDDPSHRNAPPYASMSIEDIRKYLPTNMPHKDCILWLWTTNTHMREAFTVVDAWGFTQKTILTWVKNKIGTGDWLRGQTEHCIMAVRGKPTVVLTNQSTVLTANAGKHSAKPDEFYAMVAKLCPGSCVELFQRTSRPGIVGTGLEVS
ncbi:hypothetical protein LCGC14_1152630 [marine sediment metagenome]|uniref:ParB-like N-terminal domain-containing protein n=1 Tax=marine sediment metagenome TaxID=412755 RepID=A0A0F9PD69_9ZZZZ